ncbi:hypothetical protein NPIL_272571 [Nephila pilipes]|uniref:Uncharacterized protein n=1 Tax=Nephila pilipes TaxID=299642 RepID=A0A8X6Q2X4_NEPPI|nr:hypothetical protein NPIL_272571 [Nephila pilipes]
MAVINCDLCSIKESWPSLANVYNGWSALSSPDPKPSSLPSRGCLSTSRYSPNAWIFNETSVTQRPCCLAVIRASRNHRDIRSIHPPLIRFPFLLKPRDLVNCSLTLMEEASPSDKITPWC